MAVFMIENVAETTHQEVAERPESARLTVNSQWDVRFDDTVATRTDLGKWTFIWYGEANTEPNFKRVVDLLASDHLAELWGFRGVLIAISQVDGCIYVFNDGYGSFPVYVNSSPGAGEPIVSDSLRCFAGRTIDWASFYQFLSLGYIFGAYSLFEGVSRLEANHGLKLAYGDDKPVISRFSLKNFWNSSAISTTDDLIDIFRAEAKGFEDTQIMMSGGWDSRLLLSVLEHKKPSLYTHGNLQSREIAIVRDIASTCGLPLVEHEFDPVNFDAELFSSYLRKNESAMFTHWRPAGLHAAQNELLMTAGTFGEVLGGHYGTLNTLPGKKKYASLLMHMIGVGSLFDSALHLHDKDKVLNHLKMSNFKVFWFLNSQIANDLSSKNLVEESNRRLSDLFQHYEEQGMVDAQAMFERFYTEHRGGQYINRQLTNSAHGYRFRNIFTNRDLLQAVSSVPFSKRAHNKVNKEIIKRLRPELLDFPMAATLANARRPLLIQEGSRAVRKLVEKNDSMASIYRKLSRYGDRSFGWNNFRNIVNKEWIDSLTPLLSEKIWDQGEIVKAVLSDERSNTYSLFDMISKAITLDHFITSSR
jgi:hypothetical protein